METDSRIVVLIDMDCFYCQVEEKLDPELRGKPIAVVQYNPWKGGGIIAVNYVARAMGVTRHMRGDQAKEKCPEIHLPSVPCVRGKADISKYREAGKEVARVLQKFTPLVERASIDEAYLDITDAVSIRLKSLNTTSITNAQIPNTYALGFERIEDFMKEVCYDLNESADYDGEHSRMLLVGALIVSEIRKAVFDETGYQCSAGISHNKILAKLICGMNKPNKQTILPKHSINLLYSTLPLKKVKHLGGKFGDGVCSALKISKMAELQQFSEKDLQKHFDEKNGSWLYKIARGTDTEPVQARFSPKSIGCCKQFKGKNALLDLNALTKWLSDLGDEIEERLEKDALESNRIPKQMVVSFALQYQDGKDVASSRSYNFQNNDIVCGEFLGSKALEILTEAVEPGPSDDGVAKLKFPVKFLGISVGKFEDLSDKKVKKIKDYFSTATTELKQEDVVVKADRNAEKINQAKEKENMRKAAFERFFKESKSNESNGTKLSEEKPRVEIPSEGANIETKNENENQEEPLKNNTSEEHMCEPKNEELIQLHERPVSPILSNLNQQESFFRKYLQANFNSKTIDESPKPSTSRIDDQPPPHPPTPVCNVLEADENSSDYSGSTIEMEINQSRNIFEESPEDILRVTNTRKLMSTSFKLEENAGAILDEDENTNMSDEMKIKGAIEAAMFAQDFMNVDNIHIETFICQECNKKVLKCDEVTHSDYHLALKLREEDRMERRNAAIPKRESSLVRTPIKVKRKSKSPKSENVVSIKSFFQNYSDDAVREKCAECGKKIQIDQLPEHLDFHEAQRISRELNRKSPVLAPILATAGKRKRNASPVKKPKVQCRSIESFFG